MRGLFLRLRLRGFLLGWFHGLLIGLGTLGVGWALAVLWPGVIPWLVPVSAAAAASITGATWWPLRNRRALAYAVFRRNPLGEDLLSAVELGQRLPPELQRTLWHQVQHQVPHLLDSLRPSPWALRWFFGGWILALALTALDPLGAVRALYTAVHRPWPLQPRLTVITFPRAVFAGSPVTVTVETWQLQEVPVLVFNSVDTLRPVESDTAQGRYRFEKLALSPGTYRFQAVVPSGLSSPPCTLQVFEEPLVQDLQAVVRFPAYTGWPPETLTNPYRLQVLQGSALSLEGRLALADSGWLVASCKAETLRLAPDQRFQWRTARLSQPCSLGFVFFRAHLQRRVPDLIRIHVTRDAPPRIRLLAPRGRVDLPDDERLSLWAYAEDDWGLRRIQARVELHGTVQRLDLKTLPTAGVTLDTLQAQLDLSPFDLMPGEALTLVLEAVDRAGQVGESEPLTVRFPSLEDLYAETEAALQTQEQGTAALEQQTRALARQLQEIAEQVKARRELDWATRERLQAMLQQQERMLEALNQQVQQVQQALKRMDALSSVDPELAERAQRVAELFQEVASEELRRVLEKLQKTLQRANPVEMSRMLEQLQQNQEALRQRLERLEQVLERFRRELKLAELEERIAELSARQADLAERTQQATSPEESQALAQEQEQLQQQLETALQEMQNLAQDLASEAPQVADSLRTLSEQQGQPAEQAMQQAQASLQQQNFTAAQRSQQRALQRLMNLRQGLNQLRHQWSQQQRQEVVQQIRRIRRDLLFLARQQAHLWDQLDAAAGPVHPEAAARESQALADALEPIAQQFRSLMSQTLVLSNVMMDLLQRIRSLQEEATQALSQGAYAQARQAAGAAYGLMNRTLLLLFQAEKKAQQSGSGTGVEQMLQQLEQLAEGQMQLNQATQSLLPLPSPVPGDVLARLQQLAEQQRALREALERLQEALQQGTGMEQALEGARQAMEEAERALRQGQVTPEVRRHQEKALERLLQAERALRKREFARRRKSTPGRAVEPPDVAPLERATLRDQARRLLLELQRQPEASGYRRLTEAYLRTLLRLLNR